MIRFNKNLIDSVIIEHGIIKNCKVSLFSIMKNELYFLEAFYHIIDQ
jgi:hypothetical protein